MLTVAAISNIMVCNIRVHKTTAFRKQDLMALSALGPLYLGARALRIELVVAFRSDNAASADDIVFGDDVTYRLREIWADWA